MRNCGTIGVKLAHFNSKKKNKIKKKIVKIPWY